MQSKIYVAMSAQLSLNRRLETVANNVANASTAGFRAEEVSFEELMSKVSGESVSYVSRGKTHLSMAAGEMTSTGNPLDIAVRGEAWFGIETANGTAYTRDGRLRMDPDGTLRTLSGFPMLDSSGSPLQLDPNGPTPLIAGDGTVTQGSRRLGAVGLFRMDPNANLVRGEGASVIPDVVPTPELDFAASGVVQGFVEKSNVNGITEMSRLIAIQRAFEAVSGTISDMETAQQDAIRILSGS